MKILNPTEARKNIYKIQREIIKSHEPVLITGKEGNTIMVSEEDWNAIQETLFLLSVPGMRESIKKGMETPLEECLDLEELGWDTK